MVERRALLLTLFLVVFIGATGYVLYQFRPSADTALLSDQPPCPWESCPTIDVEKIIDLESLGTPIGTGHPEVPQPLDVVIKQTSPQKSAYAAGEILTFSVTIAGEGQGAAVGGVGDPFIAIDVPFQIRGWNIASQSSTALQFDPLCSPNCGERAGWLFPIRLTTSGSSSALTLTQPRIVEGSTTCSDIRAGLDQPTTTTCPSYKLTPIVNLTGGELRVQLPDITTAAYKLQILISPDRYRQGVYDEGGAWYGTIKQHDANHFNLITSGSEYFPLYTPTFAITNPLQIDQEIIPETPSPVGEDSETVLTKVTFTARDSLLNPLVNTQLETYLVLRQTQIAYLPQAGTDPKKLTPLSREGDGYYLPQDLTTDADGQVSVYVRWRPDPSSSVTDPNIQNLVHPEVRTYFLPPGVTNSNGRLARQYWLTRPSTQLSATLACTYLPVADDGEETSAPSAPSTALTPLPCDLSQPIAWFPRDQLKVDVTFVNKGATVLTGEGSLAVPDWAELLDADDGLLTNGRLVWADLTLEPNTNLTKTVLLTWQRPATNASSRPDSEVTP